MRNVVILLLYTAFMVSCSNTTSKLRIKTNIGSNWQFKLDTCSTWQRVNMPHTMHIEPLIVVNQFQGKCWYKKTFTAPDTAYQKVMFYFEGVMTQVDVYINDVKIASHIGGYLPFWIDATSFVNPNASNEIKLCVSNEENAQIPPGKPLKELDFNYYGGIYRNVYLVCMHKIHITQAVNPSDIAQGGIWVNFNEISPSQAKGLIKVQVINELPHDKEISLCLQITDAYGKIIELKTKKESLKAFARKNTFARKKKEPQRGWCNL